MIDEDKTWRVQASGCPVSLRIPSKSVCRRVLFPRLGVAALRNPMQLFLFLAGKCYLRGLHHVLLLVLLIRTGEPIMQNDTELFTFIRG